MLSKNYKFNLPHRYEDLSFLPYIEENYSFKKKKQVDKICRTMIYNLFNKSYNGFNKEESEKYNCIPLSPNKFPLNEFSYRSTKNALQVLSDLDMIKIKKGKKYLWRVKQGDKIFWSDDPHKESLTTQIFLNCNADKWKNLCDILNIRYITFGKILFTSDSPYSKAPIVEREKLFDENGKKIRDDRGIQKFKQTANFNKVHNYQIRYINSAIRNLYHPDLTYHRVFGKDDNEMGRYYNSFQRIPKSFRKYIYEQENWTEIDYTACQPNILYYMATGKPYKEVYGTDDVYMALIDRLCLHPEYRELAKILFISIVSCNSRKQTLQSFTYTLSQWGIYNTNEQQGIKDLDKPYNPYKFYQHFSKDTPCTIINSKYLLKIMEEVYKEFIQYFYCSAYKITQSIESKIITEIMIHQVNDNIIPLTIHDAIVVPKEYENKYNELSKKLFIKILKQENLNQLKSTYYTRFNIFNIFNLYLYYYDLMYNDLLCMSNRITNKGILENKRNKYWNWQFDTGG